MKSTSHEDCSKSLLAAPHSVAEDPIVYGDDRHRIPYDHTQGETLRLAVALIDGATRASADRVAKAQELRVRMARAGGSTPVPDDAGLADRMHRLARAGDRGLAEQLRLLTRFDEAQLWKPEGCRDCVQWMDRHLGLHRIAAYERLRVARALQQLPIIESLFGLGKLSYSKTRELTRIADADTERELAAAVLDLSAAETAEFCRRWRFGQRDADNADGQSADDRAAAEAMDAFTTRSVTLRELGRGRGRITMVLPLELYAEFVKVLECLEDQLREDEPDADQPADSPVAARTSSQLRADAAVLLARRALAHEGEAIAKADRYRVLLSAPVSALADSGGDERPQPDTPLPQLIGFGPIAHATARRLAETATLTVLATHVSGEVVGAAHDTRLWPRPMVRAVLARDRCCQMPGCSRSRFMQLHHVIPVAEGGRTEVTNAALICSTCHRALHEGGFALQRVSGDDVDLGDAADTLKLDDMQQRRARERVAQVQRFRLLRRDGAVVAGPKRAAAVYTCKQRDTARAQRLMSMIAAS